MINKTGIRTIMTEITLNKPKQDQTPRTLTGITHQDMLAKANAQSKPRETKYAESIAVTYIRLVPIR